MNRLRSAGFEVGTPPLREATPAHEESYTLAGHPWEIFAPLHYEPNYAYPLLIWLHTEGQTERSIRRVMPLISTRNYVAVAPRGVAACEGGGFTWPNTLAGAAAAEENLVNARNAATERFRIAMNRVFLLGHGAGATMALQIALADPGRYAGVIAMNGSLPTQGAPLAQFKNLRALPVLFMVGNGGEHDRPQQFLRDARLLHMAGLTVKVASYDGDAVADPTMLADADRWLMQRVCDPPAVA